ncbi:MAG: hypothetical protein HXY52_06455 [Nitrospirae bacterium]|jgi:hypothetical protein|nr:hypothetical protein [Nitrospirota bacterium]
MNKYQKIAIIIAAIILVIVFGKTITRIGFSAIGFLWKGIVIVIATVLIISWLKKLGKGA